MQFTVDTDAAVLIVMGQSNAYGHGTQLKNEDIISSPLKNVYGLARELNQSFYLNDVKWEGFLTSGMNLGAGQDNTASIPNILAKKWQKMVDDGEKLPDLYIIQISSGGQGIDEVEKNDNNKWQMGSKRIINNAPWPEGHISLYPLAQEVLTLAMQNLRKKYKNPKIIGLHWNQWETEADTGGHAVENARKNYTKLFEGFKKAIAQPFPIYFYRALSQVYDNPTAVKALDELFFAFEKEWENTCVIDITKSDFYDNTLKTQGIFQEDCVHYSNKAQEWFTQFQLDEIFKER